MDDLCQPWLPVSDSTQSACTGATPFIDVVMPVGLHLAPRAGSTIFGHDGRKIGRCIVADALAGVICRITDPSTIRGIMGHNAHVA